MVYYVMWVIVDLRIFISSFEVFFFIIDLLYIVVGFFIFFEKINGDFGVMVISSFFSIIIMI